jgi:hypothetical protein
MVAQQHFFFHPEKWELEICGQSMNALTRHILF